MAFNTVPSTCNWLLRAAAKVQAAAHRNAKFKYKKKLETLTKENIDLKNSRDSILSDYHDLVKKLEKFDERIMSQEIRIAAIRVPDTLPLQTCPQINRPEVNSIPTLTSKSQDLEKIGSKEIIHTKVVTHPMEEDPTFKPPLNVSQPPVVVNPLSKNAAFIQSSPVSVKPKVVNKKRHQDEDFFNQASITTNNQLAVPPSIHSSVPPVLQPSTGFKSSTPSFHKRRRKKK